jgi:hypothetical protein
VAAGARQVVQCNPSLILARFADQQLALLHIPKGTGSIYWLTAPVLAQYWPGFLRAVARKAGLDPGLRVRAANLQDLSRLEFRVIAYGGGHLAYFYNLTPGDLVLRFEASFPFSRIIDRRTERVVKDGQFTLPREETAILEFR